MSVHLMAWNPTSKRGGRGDGNLSLATIILVVNRNNKKYL